MKFVAALVVACVSLPAMAATAYLVDERIAAPEAGGSSVKVCVYETNEGRRVGRQAPWGMACPQSIEVTIYR